MALSLHSSAPSGLSHSTSTDDLEYAFVRMLEVRVHWGERLLSLQYLREGVLVLGEGTELPIPNLPRFEVARMSTRGPEVCDPAHATWQPVPAEGATFEIGAFTVRAALTNECKAPAPARLGWTGVWQLALSCALHAVVLVLLANLAAFEDPDAPQVDDRVDTMRRLLAVADENALEQGLPSTPRVVRTSQPPDETEYYGPYAFDNNGAGFYGFTPRTRVRFTRGGGSGTRIRQGVGLSVNGRIPAEVVNRIVRQNFGRYRLCYEAGQRSQPDLAGSVVTRFVIDRTGAVSVAQDGGSSLPNRAVVGCVVRGFSKLSFPQPEGGIVTVSYPIVFAPEAEG